MRVYVHSYEEASSEYKGSSTDYFPFEATVTSNRGALVVFCRETQWKAKDLEVWGSFTDNDSVEFFNTNINQVIGGLYV